MGKWDEKAKGKKCTIISIILLICAISIFLGVFFTIKQLEENYVRYTTDQITNQIINEMKYTDFVKVDENQLAKHYDIPNDVISECSVYMNKSSENASELACFLLIDSSKYEKLKTIVTSHISTKAAGYKNLNPSQYNELKNFLITQKGRYVLVAVGNNTSAENKIFQNMFE